MSLLIGFHVNAKLRESENIISAVGSKIFPVSTASETTFPFIVYRRVQVGSPETKDGRSSFESVGVEVIVAGSEYSPTLRIANDVRKALQGNRGEYEEFSVVSGSLTSADEAFVEDTHIQSLVFEFKTRDK